MERIKPLLKAALNDESGDEAIWKSAYFAAIETTPPPFPLSTAQTPLKRNADCVVNSTECRPDMDPILKEELKHIYVNVPDFEETFFEGVVGLKPAAKAVFKNCKKGKTPLYSEKSGWKEWPQSAEEQAVLKWLKMLIPKLTNFSKRCKFATKDRRLFALPNKTLQPSTARRKLDVGFVEHPKVDKHCNWSHILVAGELKRNPTADIPSGSWLDLGTHVREMFANQDTRRFVLGFTLCGSFMRLWEFDRLGAIGSASFDINQDGLRFVSIILGFLSMNEEQLGFDPTIITADGKRFIQIERNGQQERLIIDGLIKPARCIVGRATTCWKAHREGDDSGTTLVIKDSWQYTERHEEGELIREATEKNVVNVARYYHHETVSVGNKDDDVQGNVRKSLEISQGEKRKLEEDSIPWKSLITPPPTTATTTTTTTGHKRSSSQIDAPVPSSKRTRLTPPVRNRPTSLARNRVHRRVIVRDYGKPIYKASSRGALLAAFEGCIEGCKSLHKNAGLLQRDISINNLIMNEEEGNLSWKSFVIDLDLAIKDQREGPSGADGRTGTRAFMAIGVLLGEDHSLLHDLESFFWVLFWVCVHYNGPNETRVVKRFERWNYMDMEDLAGVKKVAVDDERHFLKIAQENFTPYYQPLICWVNKLRRVVFKRSRRSNHSMYSNMMEILRAAQVAEAAQATEAAKAATAAQTATVAQGTHGMTRRSQGLTRQTSQ